MFLHCLGFLAQAKRENLSFITFNEFSMICCRFLNFHFKEKNQKNLPQMANGGALSQPLLDSTPCP
jgi:hypothetical protein